MWFWIILGYGVIAIFGFSLGKAARNGDRIMEKATTNPCASCPVNHIKEEIEGGG